MPLLACVLSCFWPETDDGKDGVLAPYLLLFLDVLLVAK